VEASLAERGEAMKKQEDGPLMKDEKECMKKNEC
jgi:hypothetical protein